MKNSCQPSSRNLRRLGFASLLVLIYFPSEASAQSGRRAARPQPNNNPPASSSSDAGSQGDTLATSLGSLQQKVRLLVGRQRTKKLLPTEDVIFASFFNRLSAYRNVESVSLGDLKSQEAVLQAKGETEKFVVLLSFEIDSFQGGTIILNSPDLKIEYRILAPRTGKKLSEGKIYFQAIGGGRMRKSEWPGGTPIRITPEAAGIEAAVHVHDWLRLDEAHNRKVH